MPGWGRPNQALRGAVAALPRIGVHRWPATLWPTPATLHPAGTEVTIAEEHGGFAFGGNKVRQVDALLGAARQRGADTVITSAGPQSNLCRVVAAAARAAGMEVHLVLRGTPPTTEAGNTGNQVLYELSGAHLHWLDLHDPFDPAQEEYMVGLAEQVGRTGGTPSIVDVRAEGGDLCALASTAIVEELAGDAALGARPPQRIVLAASAGNTAGGLVAALAARGASVAVSAVSASGSATQVRQRIVERAQAALAAAGLDADLVDRVDLEVTDEFLGAGHGAVTPEAVAAQQRTARRCGSYLDTTYTAKAMAALLADPRPGPVLFLHTGGGPTLFSRSVRD